MSDELKVLSIEETSKNIHKMIKKSGLTHRYIASKLFVNKQAVYKWTQGRCLPTIDNLVMLASILGCSVCDLIVEKESEGWQK